jgi:hypothetical protein
MSTVLRNARTFQNRNPLVTRTEEKLHGPLRSQQRELVAQQNLILMEQMRKLRQKKKQGVVGLGGMGAVGQSGARGNGVRGPVPLIPIPMGHREEELKHQLDHKSGMGIGDGEEDEPHMGLDLESMDRGSNQASGARIFVSVASYRDPEAILTVSDLFLKADQPDRVVVGLYEQNDPVTDKKFTLSHLLKEEPGNPLVSQLVPRYEADQLRVMTSPCTDAKGPMYARALIEENLFSGEDFYMIIDSHSLFVHGWDTLCINEWNHANTKSAKPVLSYYAPNFDRAKRAQTPLELNPTLKLDYLRFLKFDSNSGFPMPTKQSFKNMPREPIPALFWTACFSFASSTMVHEVPFDKEYPFLFLGEEICMNMRMWTHGYDVYNPSKHVLFHIESRDYRPTFWELFHEHRTPTNASFTVTEEDRKVRKVQHTASIQRMSQLLCNYKNYEKGLGNVRSYAEFCDFIGINFVKQQAKDYTTFGRTKVPSREEQYAKMAENTAVVKPIVPVRGGGGGHPVLNGRRNPAHPNPSQSGQRQWPWTRPVPKAQATKQPQSTRQLQSLKPLNMMGQMQSRQPYRK